MIDQGHRAFDLVRAGLGDSNFRVRFGHGKVGKKVRDMLLDPSCTERFRLGAARGPG